MGSTATWSDLNNISSSTSSSVITLAAAFDWHLFLTKSIPVQFAGKTSNLYLRLISLLLGYACNLVVIVVIALRRSLWSPRHLHWGSVCFSGVIIELLYTFEMVGSLLEFRIINPTWCKMYAAFCGLPFTILLTSVLLASWDRHQAITKPLWHKRYMTSRRAIVQIVLSHSLTVLLVLSPFICQLIPLQCGHNLVYTELMCFMYLTLVHICLFLHVRVFCVAHRALRNASIYFCQRSRNKNCPVHVRFKTTAAFLRWYNTVSRNKVAKGTAASFCLCYESRADIPSCNPLARLSTASRLDLRAAFTVTLGMAPLWAFTLPYVLGVFLFTICLQVNVRCVNLQYVLPFLREVYVLYATYNPIVYIWRSKEFRFAAKNLWKRRVGSF